MLVCSIVVAQNKENIRSYYRYGILIMPHYHFANATIKVQLLQLLQMKREIYFECNSSSYTIVFSFLGYENVEVPVTVKSGRRNHYQ